MISDLDETIGRAIEGTRFTSPESIIHHLATLINQSKDQVEKFGQLIKSATIVGGGQLTPAHLKECEKQRNLWQKRFNGLKKLKLGLETSGRPHAPSKVIVEVTGPRKIRVKLNEPEIVSQHSLFTKFKIQWSKFDSFNVIQGEITVFCSSNEGKYLECFIDGLEEAERYFVRASFGNLKGFGPFSASIPKSVIPSSWRSVQGEHQQHFYGFSITIYLEFFSFKSATSFCKAWISIFISVISISNVRLLHNSANFGSVNP